MKGVGDMLIEIIGALIKLLLLGLVIFGAVKGILALKRLSFPEKKKTIISSLIYILIVTLSWFFNFGWIRFVLTLYLIPLIHAIIFFVMNILAGKFGGESAKLKMLSLIFVITYFVSYFLFPDGIESEMYFFFGLIKSNMLSDIASVISHIAGFSHFVILILEIIEIIKIRKQKKQGS